MATTLSLPAARPNYHALSQPITIGQARVIVSGQHAGTVTTVRRINTNYYSVVTRETVNAFRPNVGVAATVWYDQNEGQWVADYWAAVNMPVEAGRARFLPAALAIAVDSTERRGHDQGRW